MNREQVAMLIARRDNISFEEAMEAVEDCANLINELFETAHGVALYDEAADILADELGLEPDYLFDIII